MADIRWQQRLENFTAALNQLTAATSLSKERSLTDLEKQGLIQAFEYCYELAWNVMKDYFEFLGTTGVTGPRDAFREAFNKGLIKDGNNWMEMIRSRNDTSHTYNKEIAEQIVGKILRLYFPLFSDLKNKLESLR